VWIREILLKEDVSDNSKVNTDVDKTALTYTEGFNVEDTAEKIAGRTFADCHVEREVVRVSGERDILKLCQLSMYVLLVEATRTVIKNSICRVLCEAINLSHAKEELSITR
jgi:hypothetical protein